MEFKAFYTIHRLFKSKTEEKDAVSVQKRERLTEVLTALRASGFLDLADDFEDLDSRTADLQAEWESMRAVRNKAEKEMREHYLKIGVEALASTPRMEGETEEEWHTRAVAGLGDIHENVTYLKTTELTVRSGAEALAARWLFGDNDTSAWITFSLGRKVGAFTKHALRRPVPVVPTTEEPVLYLIPTVMVRVNIPD